MTTRTAAKELMNLAGQICALAKKAGEEILQFYHNGVVVTRKEDASPLTLADRASHDFLTKSLRAILPDTIVISEESAEVERRPLAEAERFWLVDPLDRTKEFIKGTNEFTVNIALIDKGHPILGIVHGPALDLTYYGVREAGSWRAIGFEPAKGIHTRPAKFLAYVRSSQ
jgi:3'(2'), 5'-bisphosphate nucleotidase